MLPLIWFYCLSGLGSGTRHTYRGGSSSPCGSVCCLQTCEAGSVENDTARRGEGRSSYFVQTSVQDGTKYYDNDFPFLKADGAGLFYHLANLQVYGVSTRFIEDIVNRFREYATSTVTTDSAGAKGEEHLPGRSGFIRKRGGKERRKKGTQKIANEVIIIYCVVFRSKILYIRMIKTSVFNVRSFSIEHNCVGGTLGPVISSVYVTTACHSRQRRNKHIRQTVL